MNHQLSFFVPANGTHRIVVVCPTAGSCAVPNDALRAVLNVESVCPPVPSTDASLTLALFRRGLSA